MPRKPTGPKKVVSSQMDWEDAAWLAAEAEKAGMSPSKFMAQWARQMRTAQQGADVAIVEPVIPDDDEDDEEQLPLVVWPARWPARGTGGRNCGIPKLRTGSPPLLGWPGTVAGTPWTLEHFYNWCSQLVFEDDQEHPPEDWQMDVVEDFFMGYEEIWLVVPEGNSKTTLMAELGLYHLDNTKRPWVPIGASSRDQAEILFGQVQGFVERSRCLHGNLPSECCGVPGLQFDRHQNPRAPFMLAGNRQIRHVHNGGKGMKVYASDVDTADGVIPTLSLLDEGHRHKHLGLYRTWKGKGNKRAGQIGMISTAGEPGSDFENTRKEFRDIGEEKTRRGQSYLRAASETTVIHEYAIPKPHLAENLDIVKEANPLSTITVDTLRQKRNSPSLDYGESWLRLTCNVPARSNKAGVSEIDWDNAYTDERMPEGVPCIVGCDVAWKLDCFAIVPIWEKDSTHRIVDRVEILSPPRDGTMLPVAEVKDAFMRIHSRNPIKAVVIDPSDAQDTINWLENGEDGPKVKYIVERDQTNKFAIEDYALFNQALRGGASDDEDAREPWLWHNGDPELRVHVMNAIARKLPADKYRFDRENPSRAAAKQDNRVIDALSALCFANSVIATGWKPPSTKPMIAVVGRR